jgi:hypothetical protein
MSRVSHKPVMWLRFILLSACLMAFGCASQSFLGENPARVRVEIQGQAKPMALPETAHSLSRVTWDWGFYLVREDGSLRKLREAGGQRTTVLETNPLQATGDFLVPAGKNKSRLMVEAYQYYYIGMKPAPHTLIYFQRDYKLDLGPGGTGQIKVRVGGVSSE